MPASNPRQTDLSPDSVSPRSESILRILLYYSIFRYPLKIEELCEAVDGSALAVKVLADQMVSDGWIYEQDGFYSVSTDESWMENRKKGNADAARVMPTARKRADFIYRFPFVRGVMVSGSLSKGYFDDAADVDYFIITHPGRLWIARTLLILYKKIFLFNSRKYFCVNYFVDTDHLRIEEQNVFTATEIQTLMPLAGSHACREFFSHNLWIKDYFAGKSPRYAFPEAKKRTFRLKGLREAVLNVFGGSLLDSFFMRITLRRWKRKFGDFQADDFAVAFKSRRYISKHHPGNYQAKVLNAFAEKVAAFEEKNGIRLS